MSAGDPALPGFASSGVCPRCGTKLDVFTHDEFVHAAGRVVTLAEGFERCVECDDRDAYERAKARAPWLYEGPATDRLSGLEVDDVMLVDYQQGFDDGPSFARRQERP